MDIANTISIRGNIASVRSICRKTISGNVNAMCTWRDSSGEGTLSRFDMPDISQLQCKRVIDGLSLADPEIIASELAARRAIAAGLFALVKTLGETEITGHKRIAAQRGAARLVEDATPLAPPPRPRRYAAWEARFGAAAISAGGLVPGRKPGMDLFWVSPEYKRNRDDKTRNGILWARSAQDAIDVMRALAEAAPSHLAICLHKIHGSLGCLLPHVAALPDKKRREGVSLLGSISVLL